MLSFFSSHRPRLVGVDITPSEVRLLELNFVGNCYGVEAYAIVELSENMIEGEIVKSPELLSAVIRQAVKQSNTKATIAAIAIPDSLAMTKVVQMNSSLNEVEIERQLTINTDQYISFPIEEVNLDFSILGLSKKQANCLDILIVATRTENIESRVKILSAGRLITHIADVESQAIERACCLTAFQFPHYGIDQIIAVVDLNFQFINLIILHDLRTVFTRKETWKEEEIADNKKWIINQLKRSLQFFFSTTQYNEINHLAFIGKMELISDLQNEIKQELKISTSVVNPFENMIISPSVDTEKLMSDSSQFIVCCGLALRGFEKGSYVY